MKRVKLKQTVDFLLTLFNAQINRPFVPHMRKVVLKKALAENRVLYVKDYEGCLVWSVFKVNSPIYIGCKGDFQIKQIVVSEKARGIGVAKELFLKAKGIAENRNCPRIVLTVRNDNKRAQGFYKKMGMKKIKETRIITKTSKKEIVYAEYILKLSINTLI